MIGLKFLGQAGPRQVDVSRFDAELKCTTPGMDWVSGSRGPFWQFLVIARLSIWLSMLSSGKIMKYVKTVSQAQSLLSRACDVTGLGSMFCGQECVL